MAKTIFTESNIQIPSQAEAEAGVIDNKYMTPLKTKQAIDALQSGIFISSDLGIATGSTSAIPAGATMAIINVTANSGDSGSFGGISQGQLTIFSSGLTSATFREVGNINAESGVTVSWSAPNINVSAIGVAGSVDIYYFT